GRGLDDPGVLLAGARIGALLRAEDGGSLLGLADEEDTLAPLELGPVREGDVLLALPFGEGEQGHLLLADEVLDGGDEGLADGVHEGGRSEGMAAVEAEEGGDAGLMLQLGLVDVEVHAVDAFDFQGHVLANDFSNGARYTHGWLRSSWSFAD